jgi:hypothetical protein
MLGPEERLLYYSLGYDSSFVLLVSPGTSAVQAHPLRLGANVLTRRRAAEAVASHLASLVTEPSSVAAPSRELFEALVPEAVWKEIRGARRVYVVGHGPLQSLPFEALVVGTAVGKPRYWLDEGPPVAYASSGSVLAWVRARHDAQRPAATLSLTALGDPVFVRAAPAWPDAGVLVLTVRPEGRAATLGLRPGDVLTSYGGHDLSTPESLTEAIASSKSSTSIPVRVNRGGAELDVNAASGDLGVELARDPPPVSGPRWMEEGERASTNRGIDDRGRRLAALPGTRQELEKVGAVFRAAAPDSAKVDLLLGAEATEANLFDRAKGARFLHLATHGIVDETTTASFSGLALTPPPVAGPGDDGFLSLTDLLGRWRGRLEDTELVVLSACDSQKGPLQYEEGTIALPLGIHFAGCPTVVGSLWKVSDDKTPALMEDFYRRLLAQGGKDKLRALVEAKRAIREKDPDPSVWAAFVLLGDPR